MGDPLSVAASVAGLLSLGIQVSQSLVTYYTEYRNQDFQIDRITLKLDTLSQSFQSRIEALAGRRFDLDERALVAQIENSVENCNDLILELQEDIKVPPGQARTLVNTLCH
jgi:ankyrin repeat domain-containing protein 50